MATKKSTKSSHKKPLHHRVKEYIFEGDSLYLLKLMVFLILGTLWLKFTTPFTWLGIGFNAIPLGLIVGILAVRLFEKHQSDRKIWYAVLILVGVISYYLPAGIVF